MEEIHQTHQAVREILHQEVEEDLVKLELMHQLDIQNLQEVEMELL